MDNLSKKTLTAIRKTAKRYSSKEDLQLAYIAGAKTFATHGMRFSEWCMDQCLNHHYENEWSDTDGKAYYTEDLFEKYIQLKIGITNG